MHEQHLCLQGSHHASCRLQTDPCTKRAPDVLRRNTARAGRCTAVRAWELHIAPSSTRGANGTVLNTLSSACNFVIAYAATPTLRSCRTNESTAMRAIPALDMEARELGAQLAEIRARPRGAAATIPDRRQWMRSTCIATGTTPTRRSVSACSVGIGSSSSSGSSTPHVARRV